MSIYFCKEINYYYKTIFTIPAKIRRGGGMTESECSALKY